MKSNTALIIIFLTLAAVSDAQNTYMSPIYTPDGATVIKDEYLIVLHRKKIEDLIHIIKKLSLDIHKIYASTVLREYKIGNFMALYVKSTRKQIEWLRERTEIDYIESNIRLKVEQPIRYGDNTTEEPPICIAQRTGRNIWGLSRIVSREGNRFETYDYGSNDAGDGVDVYIADTGVYVDHDEFEGRAQWGLTAKGALKEQETDLHGHGTHVAGIVAAKTFGVAKKANIIAIKVLDRTGAGSVSDILEGIQWARNRHLNRETTAKSVLNLSLGSAGVSYALEHAILEAIDSGVNVVVAAGNDAADACGFSPARISQAITVMASTPSDALASFSNYGPCSDIAAPGTEILSSYIGSPTSTSVLQGTSMSSPFVVGVVARYLSRYPEPPTPMMVKAWVMDSATAGALTFSPQHQGTPDKLLYMACGALGDDPERYVLHSGCSSYLDPYAVGLWIALYGLVTVTL